MVDIIRAWKDPVYRAKLNDKERSLLPENPAGFVELTDEELMQASGLKGAARTTCYCCTDTSRPFRCCP